jgi:hypothetical protein
VAEVFEPGTRYEPPAPYDIDDIKNAITAEMQASMAGVHDYVLGPGDDVSREACNQTRPVLGDDGLPAA